MRLFHAPKKSPQFDAEFWESFFRRNIPGRNDLSIFSVTVLVPLCAFTQSCETAFKFTNRSEATVTIDDLQVSCGCTEAVTTKERVSPGEEGLIRVKFSVPPNSDPVMHSVMVGYHTTHKYSTRLFLQADPEWPVAVSPAAVHIVPAVSSTDAVAHVEVYSTSNNPLGAIEVDSPKGINTELETDGKTRKRYRISISAEREGLFQGQVVFSTGIADRPKIVVPVTVRFVSGASAIPSRLLLGTLAAGETVERNVVIHGVGDGNTAAVAHIKEEGWRLDETRIEETEGNGRSYHFSITVPTSIGYQKSTLVIKDIDGRGGEFSIPVSCVVSSE